MRRRCYFPFFGLPRRPGFARGSSSRPPAPDSRLAELAQASGAPSGNVHREVERLEAAGLVRSERVGHTRLISPDTESPLHDELRGLNTKALVPVIGNVP